MELQEVTKLAAQYKAELTPYVILSCVMAASGGLMYGYDLVVAGGVAIMDGFLEKFYPGVLRSKRAAHQDNYCKYNDNVFQLFASCMYLAALLTTFISSTVTRRGGRKLSMQIAGVLFLLGTGVGAGAQNLAMLLASRALLGCGLGFSNQAVPLYLSEIAPAKLRGALNYLFLVYTSFGILMGNVVNYIAAKYLHPSWAWRFSLAMAGVPAALLTAFSIILVDSPASLVQRGRYDEAKLALAKIRGPNAQIDGEFRELLQVSTVSTHSKGPLQGLFTRRRNIPSLVLGMVFPFFQQVAGNDAIMFYGAFLFKLAGFHDQAALYSAVITGGTSFLSVCVSLFYVDKFGRKRLLLGGASAMIISMASIGIVFAKDLSPTTEKLSQGEAIIVVILLCMFIVAFSGSIGPLGWTIPSEVYPLEVRSAGLGTSVFVNMLFKFLIAQTFLSMLCFFKFGMFLFFAGWMLLMALFVIFLCPETKGVPIDGVQELLSTHWFWKRVVSSETLP